MESLVLIPKKVIDKILTNQENLLKKINRISSDKKNPADYFKYITEAEAQVLLDKKQTWFWKFRTEGKLGYTKVGSTIYYKKEDINKLFDDNFQKPF